MGNKNQKKDDIETNNMQAENNPFSEEICNQEIESVKEECDDKINTLQAEIEKLNNQYIRLAADFDNYRKRQAQERESLLKYGAEETLKKMIEALDNIDRASTAINSSDDINTVKESCGLVYKQLYETLAKMGLEVINTINTTFDPNVHEAVMQTPTSEYPEHTIIAELQKGYKLGDKVLRPALVNVAVSE